MGDEVSRGLDLEKENWDPAAPKYAFGKKIEVSDSHCNRRAGSVAFKRTKC